MSTGVRQKYNIALNGKGYIFKGSPGSPLYDKRIIPSQVDRLAISDIQYSDFSGTNLFYIAQTDFSAGIKDQKSWKDDGKFYYSTNLDVYSEFGAIKLERGLVQLGGDLLAGAELECGVYGEVNNSNGHYIGTNDDTAGNKPRVYLFTGGTTWTDKNAFTGTNQNLISQMMTLKNLLYIFTVGNGNTEVVKSFDGSTWTDHSAAILAASTLTAIQSSRAACEFAGTIYFAIGDSLNDKSAIISYDGTTFTEEEYLETSSIIISMVEFSGKIYYLLGSSSTLELRVFDPTTSETTIVRIFYNTSKELWSVGEKYLRVFGGKLIITIPNNQIYEYDGNSLIRIFLREEFRQQNNEAGVWLRNGCMEKDNKLYWNNLIYDGEVFYNYKTNFSNDPAKELFPVSVTSSGKFIYIDTNDKEKVYTDSVNIYKAADNENFLIMSEIDTVSSIDKILDNITIIFDEIESGMYIEVDYSIDDQATWTTIGDVNPSNDLGAVKRVFYPSNTIKYNKIWIKLKLNTTNTAKTPVLRDVILAYKPFPDFKIRWSMTLDASRQIGLLNGQEEERTGQEISNELWNLMNLKQKVTLEDSDYFECTLDSSMAVGDTSASIKTNMPIPRSGRLRAVTSGFVEEMYYTSANNSKITGLVRGARGTKARAYATSVILKNDYDVYINSVDTKINVTDENKQENRIHLFLTEG